MLTKNIDAMRREMAEHIAAGQLVQGEYWHFDRELERYTGCFISCLGHSDSARAVTERFGVPEPLVRIAENIFESLPGDEYPVFAQSVCDAIQCDGRDLSRVHWVFLADLLRNLPPAPGVSTNGLNKVIDGLNRLTYGQQSACLGESLEMDAWAEAAKHRAAKPQAALPRAALPRAAATAWAAAATAWTAAMGRETERQRQAETLLRIIREAE